MLTFEVIKRDVTAVVKVHGAKWHLGNVRVGRWSHVAAASFARKFKEIYLVFITSKSHISRHLLFLSAQFQFKRIQIQVFAIT